MMCFVPLLLGLVGIGKAECVGAGCKTSMGEDASALLAIKAGAKTSRALLNKRGPPAAAGVYCENFVNGVCPAVGGIDTKKKCKELKSKKGPMEYACETTFKKIDSTGYKRCQQLEKPMSKACESVVESGGTFGLSSCWTVLEENYDCVDFCGEFISSVCSQVAGPCEETKKTCDDVSKKGKEACKATFGKPPKGDLAKNVERCKDIIKPIKKECKDIISHNKKTGDNLMLDEDTCKTVLYANYNCNPCAGKKPDENPYFDNVRCLSDGVTQALEQSGINITVGYEGDFDTAGREPINGSYKDAGLCAVNVHWHLGTEHYSIGEFDENGTGPASLLETEGDEARGHLARAGGSAHRRRDVRAGFKCHHYDSSDSKFTTPYEWKHCVNVNVGETYEVHWPHSAAGRCATEWQYQTPFYDGVFCIDGIIDLTNTFEKIGVEGQIFTIVNDEQYYVPNLIDGMIKNSSSGYGTDVAYYTGSTTGTSRSNEICSKYTPITWQVDRKCHLISASSFDKMCEDMEMMSADMSGDLYPHGSRELVDDTFAADNVQLLQARL